MLFESHIRPGMIHQLDAKSARPRRPRAHSSRGAVSASPGLRWILALSSLFLLVASLPAGAQSPAEGQNSAAVAGQGTVSASAKPSTGNSATAASQKTQPGGHPVTHHHHRAKTTVAAEPVQPVAPPPPLPPAEQPATPATVDFHQGILTIQARNSSLINILAAVSRETGLVVQGLSSDQRVYGQYGPGSLASTLTALLDGSGYNFVIIGGEGGQSPRLELTTAGAAAAPSPAVVSGNQPDTPSASDQPTMADPTQPVQAKTPQEIFEELRRMHPQ